MEVPESSRKPFEQIDWGLPKPCKSTGCSSNPNGTESAGGVWCFVAEKYCDVSCTGHNYRDVLGTKIMGKSAGRMYDVLFFLFSVFFWCFFSVNLLRKLQFDMYKCILLVGMPEGSNYQRYQTEWHEWQVIVVCSWPSGERQWEAQTYMDLHNDAHACMHTNFHAWTQALVHVLNYCTWSTETLGRPTFQTDAGNLEIDIIIAKLLPARSYCIYVASNAACGLGYAFVHNIPIMNMMIVTSLFFPVCLYGYYTRAIYVAYLSDKELPRKISWHMSRFFGSSHLTREWGDFKISSLVLVSINLMILGWIWSARVWVHFFGCCISYILGTLDSALTNSMEGTKPIESLVSI